MTSNSTRSKSKIIILDKMTYAADIRNIPNINDNTNHALVVGDVSDLDVCLQVTKINSMNVLKIRE